MAGTLSTAITSRQTDRKPETTKSQTFSCIGVKSSCNQHCGTLDSSWPLHLAFTRRYAITAQMRHQICWAVGRNFEMSLGAGSKLLPQLAKAVGFDQYKWCVKNASSHTLSLSSPSHFLKTKVKRNKGIIKQQPSLELGRLLDCKLVQLCLLLVVDRI